MALLLAECDMASPSRHPLTIIGRRVFVIIARETTRHSFPEISHYISSRSAHSTAITAYYAAQELLNSTDERQAEARKLLAELLERVRAEVARGVAA